MASAIRGTSNLIRTSSNSIHRSAFIATSIASISVTILFAILLLAASPIFAQGLAGKWTGTMKPNAGGPANPCAMNLQVQGAVVTGTVGDGAAHMYPVKSGSITGNKVVLRVDQDRPASTFDFVLTLDGDTLSGTATLTYPNNDFPPMRGTVQLKRAP